MKIKHILLFCSLTFILFGCMNKQTPQNQANGDIRVEQSSYRPDNIMNNKDVADHLANIASEVPDVNDAASLVVGPYAVVAVDINEDVERQEAGTIKYTVLEAMEHDPYGRSAVVIADADMIERLREMKTSMQEGAPVNGVVEELGNIVSRYMPTFPINNQNNRSEDIVDDNQNNTDQNNLDRNNTER